MSHQENFWILLSKKLSGEASATELLELEALIIDHSEWQYAIQNLEDLWKHEEVKEYQHEEDAYLLHLHRMAELNIPFGKGPGERPASKNKVVWLKWYKVAAAVVIVLFSGFFFFKSPTAKTQDDNAINQITTRPGSRTKIQLPDGTTVLLNAGSRLTYNKEYGKELREVDLMGEAFFDVKKNKDVPFVIHTTDISIKVLGTVFNVRAYPEDKKTETSLIRGSIEVTIKNRPNNKIILSPDEKLIVENNNTDYKKENAKVKELTQPRDFYPMISVNKIRYTERDSSVIETQWTENKLVFRDESFAELALIMGRWYDLHIDITDPVLAEAHLTGTFDNETIEQALDALRVTTPFNYEKKGNNIIIHH